MGELAKERVRLGGAASVLGVIPRALVASERPGDCLSATTRREEGRQGWVEWVFGMLGLEVKWKEKEGAEGERAAGGLTGTTTTTATATTTMTMTGKGDSPHDTPVPNHQAASLLSESVYGQTSIAPSLSARKAHMIQLIASAGPGSGFIALSGGFGTLDEVMEVVTMRQMGAHGREMVLCNVEGFWDGMVGWVEGAVERGFVREEGRGLVVCREGVEASVDWLAGGERGESERCEGRR